MQTMKFCIIIATHNHTDSLRTLLGKLGDTPPVIIVDDGSVPPVKIDSPKCETLRIEKNSGKASALKLGFKCALNRGFTHAVTMDADGQHPPELVGNFIQAALAAPNAIVLGVRDFSSTQIPKARRFLNKFSNFCFRMETGHSVGDTQCGFRTYPLAEISKLKLNFEGFIFETELLVKAAWAGIGMVEIKIPTLYSAETLSKSHYRPFTDTLKFTWMNTRLFCASISLPKFLLKRLALKKHAEPL